MPAGSFREPGHGWNASHDPRPLADRITPALVEAIRSRYALEWHGIHGVNPWAQAHAFQAWKI